MSLWLKPSKINLRRLLQATPSRNLPKWPVPVVRHLTTPRSCDRLRRLSQLPFWPLALRRESARKTPELARLIRKGAPERLASVV